MSQPNTYKVAVGLAVMIVSTMMLCPSMGASPTSAESGTEPRWDQQRIRDYPIYRLLCKKLAYHTGMPEHQQWEMAKAKGKPFVDLQREKNLTELLLRYPNSDYADDAALLVARARFFYHDDAKGAIEGLYKVIIKYPKGTWIAEDQLFLEHAMISNVLKKSGKPRNGWYGQRTPLKKIEKMPEGRRRDEKMGTWESAQKELTYFEYWEKHPNLTADEARYWIAWIIIRADLKDRFAEAEQNLEQLIELRRAARRTQNDLEAAKQSKYGAGITKWMFRTERKAHMLLIDFLLKQNKLEKAKAAASDYAKLHAGHITVTSLSKKGLLEQSTSETPPLE